MSASDSRLTIVVLTVAWMTVVSMTGCSSSSNRISSWPGLGWLSWHKKEPPSALLSKSTAPLPSSTIPPSKSSSQSTAEVQNQSMPADGLAGNYPSTSTPTASYAAQHTGETTSGGYPTGSYNTGSTGAATASHTAPGDQRWPQGSSLPGPQQGFYSSGSGQGFDSGNHSQLTADASRPGDRSASASSGSSYGGPSRYGEDRYSGGNTQFAGDGFSRSAGGTTPDYRLGPPGSEDSAGPPTGSYGAAPFAPGATPAASPGSQARAPQYGTYPVQDSHSGNTDPYAPSRYNGVSPAAGDAPAAPSSYNVPAGGPSYENPPGFHRSSQNPPGGARYSSPASGLQQQSSRRPWRPGSTGDYVPNGHGSGNVETARAGGLSSTGAGTVVPASFESHESPRGYSTGAYPRQYYGDPSSSRYSQASASHRY